MTINENQDGMTMTLAIVGRMDTTTSPLVEKKIKEVLPGVLELVLDLSAVEYMSSAGLRVILSTQKLAGKTKRFSIKKPSNFCMQVFDATGMSSLLTITH
ncbi:MAG: STAS domain-containing protein [Treponema sp.]|nr:STAS domain-containing protein [Treponema sp.]